MVSYLIAASVSFSPVVYGQQSPEPLLPTAEGEETPSTTTENQFPPLSTSETPTCMETTCFPLSHQLCDTESESRITSLQITVSRSNYTLLLEGKTDQNEQCTLLEEKVIVGMKDWRTPLFESPLLYAFTHPTWYPTQKVLEDTKEKDPELYALMQYDEEDKQYFMPAGEKNPLGKVKFVVDTPYTIFLHGSPYRRFFTAQKRDFSHGCIRVEDEITLLKTLSRVAGSDCDETCIDQTLAKGKRKKITFKKPVTVKIVKE